MIQVMSNITSNIFNRPRHFRINLPPSIFGTVTAMVCNLLLAYVLYALCRIVFIAVNWNVYREGWEQLQMSDLLTGSLYFDTSAIIYTNLLYILLMLLPLHYKERPWWQKMTKWIFITVNSLAVITNLADAVYFTYTGHRTTMSVMGEFSNENNLASIFLQSIAMYWYLVLTGVAFIIVFSRLYIVPREYKLPGKASQRALYYGIQTLALAITVPLCIAGMRGGFTTAVRPITISNANQYVNRPVEAAIVLNTPFSLIRTIGKNVFVDPGYYTPEELSSIYSPLHNDSLRSDAAPGVQKRKNVVVLIVESFGREYIGEYNEKLDGGNYKGYAPFIGSMLSESLTFDYTFANGRQSIDGMPSILSGIPRFKEPFFLTPASLNDISGIAGELGKCGYSSAFFHGAENGSMGFEAFSKASGYQKYYGRTEFNADNRFNGDKDFDGTWAIWDEPFLQFYALKMTEMKEPFVTTVFTASSHHPYAIPQQYSAQLDIKGEEGNPMHKCIRYTDLSLKKFFETARKQPWFNNTIFVFTSDHTNISDHEEYRTDLGLFGSPIFFYDPSGEMPRGRRHCIAQQTDIMPTVLQYLGYNKPYVAFGIDLIGTADEDTWAVNEGNGVYQFVQGDYVIQFNGTAVTAMYNYKTDWMLKHNIASEPSVADAKARMERRLKGIIQSYMQRMLSNQLVG